MFIRDCFPFDFLFNMTWGLQDGGPKGYELGMEGVKDLGGVVQGVHTLIKYCRKLGQRPRTNNSFECYHNVGKVMKGKKRKGMCVCVCVRAWMRLNTTQMNCFLKINITSLNYTVHKY